MRIIDVKHWRFVWGKKHSVVETVDYTTRFRFDSIDMSLNRRERNLLLLFGTYKLRRAVRNVRLDALSVLIVCACVVY